MIAGPGEGAAAGHGHLRAAQADREHVIDTLKTAFVHGRLTKDELDARTGQALTSQTYAQLAALTAGIPASPPVARPLRQPPRPQNETARTYPVRNAAIGSASCLIVAVAAFLYGARLDDPATPAYFALAFVLAFMVAPCIILRGAGPVSRCRAVPCQRRAGPEPQVHGASVVLITRPSSPRARTAARSRRARRRFR